MEDVAIDRVLVPTDGSEGADAAVTQAIGVADAFDATLCALFVVDVYEMRRVTDREEAELAGRDVVDGVVARAEEAGVDATGDVREGFPHEVVLAYARTSPVDLIAMGTHGRTGLDRYLLGSVTERVVRLSPVPVLTVRTPEDGDDAFEPYADVLAPTDGSVSAWRAAAHAFAFARRFDARVHGLAVVETDGLGLDVRSADWQRERDAAARRVVDDFRSRAADAGVEADGTVERGPPGERILDAVDDGDADLVVLGTHGRTGFRRFVLGSVAESVVRLCDVPVLTVPAREREQRGG